MNGYRSGWVLQNTAECLESMFVCTLPLHSSQSMLSQGTMQSPKAVDTGNVLGVDMFREVGYNEPGDNVHNVKQSVIKFSWKQCSEYREGQQLTRGSGYLGYKQDRDDFVHGRRDITVSGINRWTMQEWFEMRLVPW